jgi:hypothetical protein
MMHYARIEVHLSKGRLLEKIVEGTAVYTDAVRPMPYQTYAQDSITANIYCNGMLVGKPEEQLTDIGGGTTEKVITFKVVIK